MQAVAERPVVVGAVRWRQVTGLRESQGGGLRVPSDV